MSNDAASRCTFCELSLTNPSVSPASLVAKGPSESHAEPTGLRPRANTLRHETSKLLHATRCGVVEHVGAARGFNLGIRRTPIRCDVDQQDDRTRVAAAARGVRIGAGIRCGCAVGVDPHA